MSRPRTSTGFTLIEMLVVISIIGVLLSVLISTFLDARANSRDKERVSDLAQLEFALSAYQQVENRFPDYDQPVTIGADESSSFDVDIDQYWDATIDDPVNNGTHYYLYDDDFICDGETYVAVLAVNMEQERNSNIATLCTDESAYPNSYVVLIDGPLTPSANPSGVEIDSDQPANWYELEENQTSLIDIVNNGSAETP